MKLANLKYDPSVEEVAPDRDHYPSLYLDAKKLEAMGVGPLKAGDDMVLIANVKVRSVSETDTGRRDATLDLIEASLKPKEEEVDASKILFPNG